MKFKYINYIASNLSRSGKKQRFVNFARLASLISVMLGTMALIISLSVLEGFEEMLKVNAVKFTSHLTIITMTGKPIGDYDKIIESLKADIPEIISAAPLIEKEGLIGTKDKVEGLIIRGINFDNDITNIRANITQGSVDFSSGDAKEIIIGERLAEKLEIGIDSDVIVYCVREALDTYLPDPLIGKFKVIGLYRTGMAKYDDALVYIPIQSASIFFEMAGNYSNSIEIMVNDITNADKVSAVINDKLGFPFLSRTVFEMHRGIFSWIELQKEPIPLVLGLISIVAILNILTTLLIIVVEKTHSIGILRALGVTNQSIIRIFTMQGLVLGVAGTILGSFMAFSAWWLQSTFNIIKLQGDIYFLDVLPMQLVPWHYGLVISISLIMSLIATLIPSYVATKVSPVSAIRFK